MCFGGRERLKFLKALALHFQQQLRGFGGSTHVKSVVNGLGLHFEEQLRNFGGSRSVSFVKT